MAPLNLSLHAQRRPVQRPQRTEPVGGPRATGARRRGRTAACTSGTARAATRWRRWRATRAPSTRCPGTPPTRTCSRRRPTTRPSASGSRPPRSAGHPTRGPAPRSGSASARMLAAPPASAAPRSPGRPGRRTPLYHPTRARRSCRPPTPEAEQWEHSSRWRGGRGQGAWLSAGASADMPGSCNLVSWGVARGLSGPLLRRQPSPSPPQRPAVARGHSLPRFVSPGP